jgi:septum formation protein
MNKEIVLILASASPRRAELMRQIGLEFQVLPSTVHEKTGKARDPKGLAQKLALDKATDVAGKLNGRQGREEVWVLGADTLVWLSGKALGKPRNPADAVRMLKALSGRTHRVVTGLALVLVGGKRTIGGVESTAVTFRDLTESEIRDYVSGGEPLDKAGAYGIQGLAGAFVKKVNGCYFNVVGLPLARLMKMIQEIPGSHPLRH